MKTKILLLSLLLPLCLKAEYVWLDVTDRYITNPSFDGNSNTGWTYTANAGSKAVNYGCWEFWNGTFDAYQTLTGLSAGKYRLSVQGYYRTQDNSAAFRDYQSGSEDITAMLYAGDTKQPLVSVYSFAFTSNPGNSWTPNWQQFYPNGMESANKAFEEGAYQNTMELNHDGGDLRIGIANQGYIYSNWCIFDNFKLEYWCQLISVTSVSIDGPSTVNLIKGEQHRLTATVSPSAATFKEVKWKSNNTSVATVDDSGLVTALSEGSTTITATSTDGTGRSASVTISISNRTATASSLVINEMMAANVDEYISRAFNFDGWIELYNPSTQAVSLSGLYVSDDAMNMKKYQLRSCHGILPAKGFNVLWFESETLHNEHLPLKLDVDGGYLAFSDEAGNIVAELTYPAAMERIAYARTTDGSGEWNLTAQATPGTTNNASTFAAQQLGAPVIDTPSQLFTGSLTTTVSIPEGALLRYTTDGSLPTLTNGETSNTGVFSFKKNTSLRLRLFKEGWLPSAVTTRSFILKDKDYQLPIISVVADESFLYDEQIGVMVRGVNGRAGNGQSTPCNWNMDWERPVNFSFITSEGKMALCQDVNLEMAGGWSRAWEPHSFKLKGNKELGGNKNLDHPFFSAKPYIRNRTLQIRNGGNDNNCRIKDAALQTIIQTSGIDIDLQSYQPIHEFINGKYIGVLNMREPNNKHYVYANYGWDDDEIDQFEMSPDSGYVQKCGTDEAFLNLCKLSEGAANAATYEEIKQLLDIDEYINYVAAEFYLGSTDWPQNNIKGFRHRDGGRFRFVSFDIDHAFSATTSTFNTFEEKQTYTFDYLYDLQTRFTKEIKFVTLFKNLLANDEFRRRFIDTFCIMGGSVFEEDRAKAIIDSLTENVTPMMALEGKSPTSTAEQMKNSFTGRMEKMMGALQSYSPMQLKSTSPQNAIISSNAPGAQIFINEVALPHSKGDVAPSFDGQLFAPVKLKAVAPAGYRFVGWRNKKDNTYFSKNEETTMPSGNFTLEAKFTALTDAEREAKEITPVRINEVSAVNDVFVNDYFKKGSWVELYNTTNKPIDIEGMYLSDDISMPLKYRITKGESVATTLIGAHGHLLIWLDKKAPISELHASFKVGDTGELLLTAADESWSDYLSYPVHDGYNSVIRYPDGENTTYVTSLPTIGGPNRINSYLTAFTNERPTSVRNTSFASWSLRLQAVGQRLIVIGQEAATALVSITNLAGQIVLVASPSSVNGQQSIDVSRLSPGCYIAHATDSEGHSTTLKFSKTR